MVKLRKIGGRRWQKRWQILTEWWQIFSCYLFWFSIAKWNYFYKETVACLATVSLMYGNNIAGFPVMVNGQLRRPDLMIRVTKNDGKQYVLIIEAKDTPPNSKYLNDSIYKVIGYLKDFDEIWVNTQQPKVVLAIPDGVKAKDSEWIKQDIFIVSGNIEEKIKSIIEKSFQMMN